MTMSDDELLIKMNKIMKDNIAEVLEDVVHPRLVELQENLTREIKASEMRLNNRIDGVESSLGKSIDNLAATVTKTKTNHEIRIVRLEEHTGLFAN